MNIYLIGHKAPDLDSVASTISYKYFLDKTNKYANSTLIPLRAGDVNKETEYIFKKFRIEIPKKIEDITGTDNGNSGAGFQGRSGILGTKFTIDMDGNGRSTLKSSIEIPIL